MDDTAVSSSDKDTLKVKRKTLHAVLYHCHTALQSLTLELDDDDDDDDGTEGDSSGFADTDADELCDLLRSRVECPKFLEKFENAQMSVSQHLVVETDDCSSWDVVSINDFWDADLENTAEDGYVLVGQEDIVDGIACIMAAYLLSNKHTKDVTPSQLQDALSKTFSAKKKKGKLRKVWEGSKVIYNVASWGATAVGMYQNPALYRAATVAFWTSRHMISKLF